MTTNSIAISRNLVAAGLELKAANAIAEVVVTNADETTVTKADFAKMEAATKADLVKVETATKENFIRVEEEMKTLATKADLAEMARVAKADLAKVEAEIAELRTDVKVLTAKVDTATKIIMYIGGGIFILLFADMLMRTFA